MTNDSPKGVLVLTVCPSKAAIVRFSAKDSEVIVVYCLWAFGIGIGKIITEGIDAGIPHHHVELLRHHSAHEIRSALRPFASRIHLAVIRRGKSL